MATLLNGWQRGDDMTKKPARDWAWKRLLEAAPPKERTLNYRRPDYMKNDQGQTVRFHVPHPVTPAIDRFFALIRKVEISDDECWVADGDTFRVDDLTVTTPARFIWQEVMGEKLKRGDALRQICKTPRCCRPAHREKRRVK
jgi:hypothetical protein